MLRRGQSVAVLIAIALPAGVSAKAVIVSISGPSASRLKAGLVLQQDEIVTLEPRDKLTLLDSRGTRTFRGPKKFRVSEPSQRIGSLEVIRALRDPDKGKDRRPGGVVNREADSDKIAQSNSRVDTPAEIICRMTGECADGLDLSQQQLARPKTAGLSFRSTKASIENEFSSAPNLTYVLVRGEPICDLKIRPVRFAFFDQSGAKVEINYGRRIRSQILKDKLEFIEWLDPPPQYRSRGRVRIHSGASVQELRIVPVSVRSRSVDRLREKLTLLGCNRQAAKLR
jgi:hypothetical protein